MTTNSDDDRPTDQQMASAAALVDSAVGEMNILVGGLHEFYMGGVNAGFTPAQALALTMQFMTTILGLAQQQGPSSDG